jgi:hypothetical protein
MSLSNFSVVRSSARQNRELKVTTLNTNTLKTTNLVAGSVATNSSIAGSGGVDNMIPITSGFIAKLNTIHLLGDTGGVITLPTAVVGNSIKFILMDDVGTNDFWDLQAQEPFSVASTVFVKSGAAVTSSQVGITLVTEDNTLFKIVGNSGGLGCGGGLGGYITLSGVDQDGTPRWLVEGSLLPQGNALNADASNFSTP